MKIAYILVLFVVGVLCWSLFVQSEKKYPIHTLLELQKHAPFNYDLDILIKSADHEDADIMILSHGYGDSNRMIDEVASTNAVQDHLVSFNFPDYDLGVTRIYEPEKTVFGSIDELLPLLFVIKSAVIDVGLNKINLYGKSAGAAAIINALGVLNSDMHSDELAKIGIIQKEKQRIISAIENGLIILNCPLKSLDEILDRGYFLEFKMVAERYTKNGMRPIDALSKLKGLNLNILLHFQNPDEVIGNRDDELFIERLKEVNVGTTDVVIGNDGGHNVYHKTLWDYYKKKLNL